MAGAIENNRAKAKIEVEPEFLDECIAKGFDPIFFTVVATGRHNVTGKHVALVESPDIPLELNDQWCTLQIVKVGQEDTPVSANYRAIWRRKQ